MRAHHLLILAACALSFFVPIGFFPLFDVDEGAFAEATRQMLAGGNFQTVYLNGELRLDKPIFTYWAQALSVWIFGINEWAFRLPSAIASSVWAFVIYRFSRNFLSAEKALNAVIFFAAALVITVIGKAATADALLNMWVALTMFAIFRHFHNNEKSSLVAAFIFAALGFLTKGPIIIFIALMTSFLFALSRRRLKFWLLAVFNPWGWAIFLGIAAPWYILEYLEHGQKFIDGLFFKHNIERFQETFEGHGGGWFYYLIALPFLVLPFSAFFARPLMKIKTIVNDDLQVFLLIWFLVVLIFFSFSATKLPHYLVYGLSPLFILASNYAQTKKNNFSLKSDFWVIFPPVLLLLFLVFITTFFSVFGEKMGNEVIFLQNSMTEIFDFDYRLKLIFAIILLIFSWFFLQNPQWRFFAFGMIFATSINFALIPALAKIEQIPLRSAAEFVRQNHLENIKIHRMHRPTFNVYARMTTAKNAIFPGDVVLTKKMHLDDFENYEVLFAENAIFLVRVGARNSDTIIRKPPPEGKN